MRFNTNFSAIWNFKNNWIIWVVIKHFLTVVGQWLTTVKKSKLWSDCHLATMGYRPWWMAARYFILYIFYRLKFCRFFPSQLVLKFGATLAKSKKTPCRQNRQGFCLFQSIILILNRYIYGDTAFHTVDGNLAILAVDSTVSIPAFSTIIR